MKRTLLATTAIAAFAAATASAVDVELYGQVNKGVYSFDDGQNTDVVVYDNAIDSTRFGFKGAQALDNGLTASVLFETEMASNPSDGLRQQAGGTTDTTPANVTNSFVERQARVGLSGAFGGVYVGQQTTAFDGTFTQDLVGASSVMHSAFGELGGGLSFRDSAGTLQTATINQQTFALDENRTDSVRYDSPIFNGFQGRASIAQGGDIDAGVYYNGGMGDFKVAGAAGAYFENDNTDQRGGAINTNTANADEAHYAASVSVAHNSGLAGTLAYSADSLKRKAANIEDPDTWYAKVGYSWDAYEVAADYGMAEGYRKINSSLDDEVASFGLGAQYNLVEGVSVAALYRNFSAEAANNAGSANINTDDVNLFGVNMHVKF